MADADARTFVRLGQGRRWGFPHGVRPARPVPVVPSSRVTLSFQGRVPPGEASFVVYLRLFDAAGADVTEGMPAPSGWAYSDVSKAFYMAPLAPEKPQSSHSYRFRGNTSLRSDKSSYQQQSLCPVRTLLSQHPTHVLPDTSIFLFGLKYMY